MLDVLTWIAVLALGGFVVIIAGAVFIWAVFWMQNGGRDE
jgi:hypothetical protein